MEQDSPTWAHAAEATPECCGLRTSTLSPQPWATWADDFPDAPPPWGGLAVPSLVGAPTHRAPQLHQTEAKAGACSWGLTPTPSAPDAWPQPQRRFSSFFHPTCKYCRTPTPAPPSMRVPVVVCLLCRSSQPRPRVSQDPTQKPISLRPSNFVCACFPKSGLRY